MFFKNASSYFDEVSYTPLVFVYIFFTFTIIMNKIQAINIVNNCFAFKSRFGRLPNRTWRGITNAHRTEAFRIVDAALKRVKEDEELEIYEDRTPMTEREQAKMCTVDPYMPRRKMVHATKKKVHFSMDYEPTTGGPLGFTGPVDL